MNAFEKNVSWIKADIEGWAEDRPEGILSIDEMNLTM
jgi:hypothetical protein